MAMEAVALFKKKVSQCGLNDFQHQFEALGWTTMADFAFSANYQPGGPDETPFINEVVIPILGDENHTKKAALRRLFFEAFTAMAADAQHRATQTDDDTRIRKLPKEERELRMSLLKAELTGLSIEGPLEPSHTLINKCHEMVESGELRHLPWSELGTREGEIRSQRTVESLKTDANGQIRVIKNKVDEPADTSTETKVRFALQRRGLAFQVARLMSFAAHEKLVAWYQREMDTKPYAGFVGVSLDQVLKADVEIFTRAAQVCGEDLSMPGDGSYPLDKPILQIIHEPRIQSLMFHMRAHERTRQRNDSSEVERLQRELKRLRQQTPPPQAKGTGKGKGKKGSGKSNKSKDQQERRKLGPRLPSALVGFNPTIDGARACFAFNLPEGCSLASAGKSCTKGVHKCMRCGGPHSTSNPAYHQQ